jgi:hypothetical protein
LPRWHRCQSQVHVSTLGDFHQVKPPALEQTIKDSCSNGAQQNDMFPSILLDGLWHTTSVDRFESIRRVGAILPEPSIPDSERYGTAQGPKGYSYVRHLGGVSLFDFTAFDEDTYLKLYPLSNWKEFVPCRSCWNAAIWIELDRSLLAPKLIDGKALLQKCVDSGAWKHRLMPAIEAAYIGALSANTFRRVLKYRMNEWHTL